MPLQPSQQNALSPSVHFRVNPLISMTNPHKSQCFFFISLIMSCFDFIDYIGNTITVG